jgi:hypothetical protein
MLGLKFLCVTLLASVSWAKPVVLPITKTDNGELSAIIPSEKVLLALLAANAVQIVIWAVKEWLKHREKKDDKTSERMDKMQADIAEIKSALRVINSRDTVTHSEMIELLKPHIELIVIKSMRK